MRKVIVLLTVLTTVVLMTTMAFGWGFGTHAYIASEIGKRGGDPNLMEVYGATLPDLFNYAFDVECNYDDLYALIHDTDFMDVFETKNKGLEKWLAKGLVMHNQPFGMDHTAHILSAVNQWPGGYVNVKAGAMNAYLIDPGIPGVYPLQAVLAGMGIEPDPDTVHSLYHTIIEYSADLLLKEAVPEVGPTLFAAANFWPYDEQFPLVLVDAFADEVSGGCGISMGQAADLLTQAELGHRQVVTYEASLLSIQDPAQALDATASHLATVGIGYLGLPYEPGTPMYEYIHAQFTQLSWGYLQVAMGYFLDDYFEELEATVELVRENMVDNGVIKK